MVCGLTYLIYDVQTDGARSKIDIWMKDFVQKADTKIHFYNSEAPEKELPRRLERIFFGKLDANSPNAAFVRAVTRSAKFHLKAVQAVADKVHLQSSYSKK